MSVTGKSSKAILKQDLINQKVPAVAIRQLVFAHQSPGGESGINLSALVTPSSYSTQGFLQPGTEELLRANLMFNHQNLQLISSLNGVLMEYRDYVIASNSQITLTASYGTSTLNEIFVGYVAPVTRTGTLVADVEFILSTGTLAAGTTDISVGKSFQTNQNPSYQVGAVTVYIDGQHFLRNVGNATAAPAADGDYEEVDNGAGRSTLLRLNASDASDRSYIVVSTATTVVRPDGSVMDEVERQAGVLDTVIETVADLAGVPESDFQAIPSQPQLKQFGDRLVAVENAATGFVGKTDGVAIPANEIGYNFTQSMTTALIQTNAINTWVDSQNTITVPAGHWHLYITGTCNLFGLGQGGSLALRNNVGGPTDGFANVVDSRSFEDSQNQGSNMKVLDWMYPVTLAAAATYKLSVIGNTTSAFGRVQLYQDGSAVDFGLATAGSAIARTRIIAVRVR